MSMGLFAGGDEILNGMPAWADRFFVDASITRPHDRRSRGRPPRNGS
jgi:hypothetical protein